MEPSSADKPKPSPKPVIFKPKVGILQSAERFFNENPEIPREKPPLAPKPVLVGRLSSGHRRSITQVVTQVSNEEHSERFKQESIRLEEALSRLCGVSETKTSTTVVNYQTDAHKIIQDTWASRTSSVSLGPKLVENTSSLYSITNKSISTKSRSSTTDSETVVLSECSETLSDLNNPSLNLCPPTPNELKQDLPLVSKENQNDSKLSSDSLSNISSLHSNISFLFSDQGITNDSEEGPRLDEELSTSASDGEVTLRSKRGSTGGVGRGSSWGEEESHSQRSRTPSVGSEGVENTVRRRISSFFGSFGKGGKTKDKRESSLFYCSTNEDSSQMESSDSGKASMTSLNETTNLSDNNNVVTKQSLTVNSDCCDRDSNRSSISDESFEGGQSIKSDAANNDNTPASEDPVERRKKKCFNIVHELMSSERVFIDVLKLLCHDFKEAVENASKVHKTPVIPTEDFKKIIKHLPQLLVLNEELLKDIESRIDSWDQYPKISDVIVKKGPFLKLYSSYIQNFEEQTEFLDDCCEKYKRFGQVVREFEKSERCKKLALKHYMLKPIQRIPQYEMLLDNYLRNQELDSLDYTDTEVALKIVCDVANHANSTMKQGDRLSKLLSIQSQLGDYEIIKPGRYFVKEGELYKLCRKDMQQRFFILLSDCLLYTSYYASMTGLKVKCKLPLAGMKVIPSHNTDFATEFSVITSTRSFILRAKSKEEYEAWLEALHKAIQDYNTRQMTFLNRQVESPLSVSNEPLKIGREAPVWIQDKKVTMCMVCTAEFTVTFRRHHCRACGKVVCGPCSDHKAPMLYRHFQSDRVCSHCYQYLLDELDDPLANMAEVIRKELKLTKEESMEAKISEIRSSFKKLGQSSARKNAKYVPPRLKEVMANDLGSQVSGWLLRRQCPRRWKRYWFVLKELVLYSYKASEDVVAIEGVPVLGYTVESLPKGEMDDIGSDKVGFRLVHPGQDPLVFATDSMSADRWIQALQDATLLK